MWAWSVSDDDRRPPDSRYPLDPLVAVMDRLLAPGGCPWDREQTHESLRPYVVEEAYEVVGAVDGGDPGKLRDELGDLLLQVVFHAALAQREGRFDVNGVVDSITEKLRRRHPHVFGESEARSPEAVLRQWEDIKKEEAAAAEGLQAPPRLEAHLPALMQAQKLLERAARLGLTPPDAATTGGGTAGSMVEGTEEETAEARFGKAIIALLEEARREGVDAELTLRQACARLAGDLDRR